MEPFIADFLLNNKIPRAVRYTVLAAIVGFIVFICFYFGIGNKSLIGEIICCAIGILMIIMGAFAAIKIHKN
ncbi:MAG: hypothetical protein IJ571_10875 [Ruminococcus sp.]|nr:hypothetical protein [Ruminococcus sp.]